MPKPGWGSISLPNMIIDELKAELKTDRVFRSMATLLTHSWRMYIKNKNSEDVLGSLLDKTSFVIMYIDQIVQPPLGTRLDSRRINLDLWQEVKETGLPFWKALYALKNWDIK